MSDLIARLEAHDRLTHFDDVVALVEEAAAALRQKEAEIAELKRALDGAVRQMHEAKTERAHMEGRAEVAERQISALRDQQQCECGRALLVVQRACPACDNDD